MKRVKLFVFVFVALALVSFMACSKPPEAEKEAAKKAMDAAIAAGADQYAPTELEPAKKLWDTAETQMKEKKYKEAKQSYIDAKAAFENAAAAVEKGKQAAVDQANAALKALEEEWKKVNGLAKKMEKKLKDKKNAWMTDAKTINEGLVKSKETIATAPAEAKAKLGELQALVDKWEAIFKEMAATPTKQTTKHKTTKKKK
jgi:ABC-type transporter Mla subunit MlaD